MINSNAVCKNLITGYSALYPNLQIKDSLINGKGIFTEVDLVPATILFEIVAEKIRYKNKSSLSTENPNWIGSGYEEWLKVGPGDIAAYLNHCCEPNVILNEKLQVITMRNVRANEELLLDYSTTELDPYWKMECSCNAAECRKVLRSFQFLPDELQKRYANYLNPCIISTAKTLALHQFAS